MDSNGMTEGSLAVFTFTRSSPLNELIEEAKKLYEDDFDPDFFIDDYREKLLAYKELEEKIREFHSNLKKIQEDLPAITEQNGIIENQLVVLFEGIAVMESYLEYGEKERIIEGLEKVKSSSDAIFSALDRINEAERELPRHSSSPHVHELIRIAKGVQHKGFPRDALKERLDWMVGYCETVHKDFQILRNTRFESDAIKDRVPEMDEGLEKCRKGLHIMEDYFNDDDPSHLDRGIELLKEGSEKLVEIHEFIQAELKDELHKTCVKCGQENDMKSRFCSQCSAVLPDSKQQVVSAAAEMSQETPRDNEERVYTQNMIVLMNAVKDHCAGRSSKESLLKVIEWMEDKIRAGSEAITEMGVPEQFSSDEEMAEHNRIRELLETGSFELETALQMMRRYFDDGDKANLQEGLELALVAGDKLYQVQEGSAFALSGS
jgi:hypothetical protein